MNSISAKKDKKPWPTKAAMEQVYQMHLWGRNASPFHSGSGSHTPAVIQPYIATVISFLEGFSNRINVCDLGCGDFNIGKALAPFTKSYVGVDIVADLIAYNTTTFTSSTISFSCLDIAVDALPVADCAMVRQVLQHLSNKEIQAIVKKLKAYKYVLVTEHIPVGDFIPNKEIISGQGTRLRFESGVDLTAAPFNFTYLKKEELLAVVEPNTQGVIVTTLYQSF